MARRRPRTHLVCQAKFVFHFIYISAFMFSLTHQYQISRLLWYKGSQLSLVRNAAWILMVSSWSVA